MDLLRGAMFDKLTVHEFFKRFPSDDACLDHLMEVRFGLRQDCRACGVEATFHRLSERRAYVCSRCGHHVYPCAGRSPPVTIWWNPAWRDPIIRPAG